MKPQRIGYDPLPSQVVLAGILINNPGADQIHGSDHTSKAKTNQGTANDTADQGIGKIERDKSNRQGKQSRSPDRYQGELPD